MTPKQLRYPCSGCGREARIWSTRRPVEVGKDARSAAFEFSEWPVVQPGQTLADRRVRLGETEERSVPQGRENPALDYENAGFDLGFVAGEVEKELLAGAVVAAKHDVEMIGEGQIALRKPGVGKAIGAALAILGPQEHERDMRSAQFALDGGPVGHRPAEDCRSRSDSRQ